MRGRTGPQRAAADVEEDEEAEEALDLADALELERESVPWVGFGLEVLLGRFALIRLCEAYDEGESGRTVWFTCCPAMRNALGIDRLLGGVR